MKAWLNMTSIKSVIEVLLLLGCAIALLVGTQNMAVAIGVFFGLLLLRKLIYDKYGSML